MNFIPLDIFNEINKYLREYESIFLWSTCKNLYKYRDKDSYITYEDINVICFNPLYTDEIFKILKYFVKSNYYIDINYALCLADIKLIHYLYIVGKYKNITASDIIESDRAEVVDYFANVGYNLSDDMWAMINIMSHCVFKYFLYNGYFEDNYCKLYEELGNYENKDRIKYVIRKRLGNTFEILCRASKNSQFLKNLLDDYEVREYV